MNAVDKTGRTALIYAAQNGMWETFSHILACVGQVDVNFQHPDSGNSALFWLIINSPAKPCNHVCGGAQTDCRLACNSLQDLEMSTPCGLYQIVARNCGLDWWESEKEPAAIQMQIIQDLQEQAFAYWDSWFLSEFEELWSQLLSHGLDLTTRNREGHDIVDLAKKHLSPRCSHYVAELVKLGHACTQEDHWTIVEDLPYEDHDATK